MRRGATIFIAWSKETQDFAQVLRDHLQTRGFSTWLSDEILPGQRFRRAIQKSVRNAHIVVAVFPAKPSPWQIAEAGLAYFEQKLIPVAIDSDTVIEPFSELQTHNLSSVDLNNGDGPSLDKLVRLLESRLGHGDYADRRFTFLRAANQLFYLGVPLLGIALGCILLAFGLRDLVENDHISFWRAGHTVFGAIVYGGGAFIALLFARAGASAGYSERAFGFFIAQRLFFMWFLVAVLQLGVGLVLWRYSGHDLASSDWLVASIFIYLVSLIFWGVGYMFYSSSARVDEQQAPLGEIQIRVFFGNLFFGLGILGITLVIVLMSLKSELGSFLEVTRF